MVISVNYLKACIKKIIRFLRRERVCEIHICQNKDGLRHSHPGYYCMARVRNIIFIITVIIVLVLLRAMQFQNSYSRAILQESSLFYLKFKEHFHPNLPTNEIKRLIKEYNTNQTIRNKCSYDYLQWKSIVLVVCVNKLSPTFQYLVVSLNQVEGIEEVLLIFSHSYYDQNLNNFIRSIDFCRVQQIFYPYSLQVYPNKFPGLDPNDCPHDMDEKMAKKKNCSGAYNPDAHGFFRDPEKAEKKHHWWWTANKVFEDLKYMSEHERLVVFLEDDLYLLEDFLHMVKKMKELLGAHARFDMLALATPTPKQFELEYNNHLKLVITPFNAENHSTALAFDESTWNKIVGHYDVFCDIDETSWSRSLFQLSKSIPKEPNWFKVLSTVQPRALKIVHKEMPNKVNKAVFRDVYRMNQLFPKTVKICDISETENNDDDLKEDILSGGWSDPRDKKLCYNMTFRKVKKLFFEMAAQYLDPNSIDEKDEKGVKENSMLSDC